MRIYSGGEYGAVNRDLKEEKNRKQRTMLSLRARKGVPQYCALLLYDEWFSKNCFSCSRATEIAFD